MKLSLNFTSAPELPSIPKGSKAPFLVAFEANGIQQYASAFFLNDYLVTFEYGCGHADCREKHGNGCPTTGWFALDSDFTFEDGRKPIIGKVLAWAPLEEISAPLAA